jgi:hypothetical protein
MRGLYHGVVIKKAMSDYYSVGRQPLHEPNYAKPRGIMKLWIPKKNSKLP